MQHHRTDEHTLWDGRILRTSISRPVDRTEYGASMWAHIGRRSAAPRESSIPNMNLTFYLHNMIPVLDSFNTRMELAFSNFSERRGAMQIRKPADLARIVKTRRHAQGLTQQDIADAVGITRQSLARIERGHGGASFDTVLRIFEKLGIHLEATSKDQHHITIPIPAPNHDALRQATSAALAATRDIDTSAIAAEVARNIDTSALTAVAFRNVDTSAIAAAATAAARNIDTSILLSRWQATLNDLTSQVRATAARAGSEPSAREARQALLNSVIEAGDPDREDSTTAEEVQRRETSDGAING